MEKGIERKRLIRDITTHISYFTDKIEWILPRDLKPRVFFGLQTNGTVVDIHDSDGYPQFRPRTPVELIQSELFAWTGTPGTVAGTGWETIGSRRIGLLITQPAWIQVPTSITITWQLGDTTPTWHDSYTSTSVGITVANGRLDYCYLTSYKDAGDQAFIGEFSENMRISVTTVGAGTSGAMSIREYRADAP